MGPSMNVAFVKALVALLPTSFLLVGSAISFQRTKAVVRLPQLIGAGCLVAVALCHICEALRLFPGMGWGLEHSVGHYLDLLCASLCVTLFSLGYLIHACVEKKKSERG